MKSRSTVPTDGPTDASRDDLAGPTKSAGARRAVATVAATVGAAAAVTTLTAPSADARSPFRYWDRVAHCESGNRWHINTGNGFYGGLQFTSSTWSAYGGGKYAWRADHASRMEQIQVARRVLNSQGPGAWPVCGPQAGLTRTTGHATAKRLPADADGVTVTHHAKRAHKAKHRAHAHSTNPHHHARHAAHGRYRVQSGDTLAKIARKKHVHGGWQALYRANRDHVHNPSVIHIGQVLRLP